MPGQHQPGHEEPHGRAGPALGVAILVPPIVTVAMPNDESSPCVERTIRDPTLSPDELRNKQCQVA